MYAETDMWWFYRDSGTNLLLLETATLFLVTGGEVRGEEGEEEEVEGWLSVDSVPTADAEGPK